MLAQNVREDHVGFGEESHQLAIGRVRSVFDHPELLASPAVRSEFDADMGNVGSPLAYLRGDQKLDLVRRNCPHGRPRLVPQKPAGGLGRGLGRRSENSDLPGSTLRQFLRPQERYASMPVLNKQIVATRQIERGLRGPFSCAGGTYLGGEHAPPPTRFGYVKKWVKIFGSIRTTEGPGMAVLMNIALVSWAPRVLSVLRIVAGLLFFQAGLQKYISFPARVPVAMTPLLYIQGLIEVIGGVLLALGLFTRPVAFILCGDMAVAYFIAHFPRGFSPAANNGNLAVIYCFVFLYFFFAGPGPWSLDRVWLRRSVT